MQHIIGGGEDDDDDLKGTLKLNNNTTEASSLRQRKYWKIDSCFWGQVILNFFKL